MSSRFFSEEDLGSNKLLKEIQSRELKKISETKFFFNKADNYERAVYNWLLYEFRLPEFFVEFDATIEGKYNIERQVDVVIYKAPDFNRPFIMAEAKRWKDNTIQLDHIDGMIGKMLHLGIENGIYISVKFSENAIKYAKNSNIEPRAMSFKDADFLNWRELIRSYFILDFSFHPQMAEALRMLLESENAKDLTPFEIWEVLDVLESLPYEEWLAWFNDIKIRDFNIAKQLLLMIAIDHYEFGNPISFFIEPHTSMALILGALQYNPTIDEDLLLTTLEEIYATLDSEDIIKIVPKSKLIAAAKWRFGGFLDQYLSGYSEIRSTWPHLFKGEGNLHFAFNTFEKALILYRFYKERFLPIMESIKTFYDGIISVDFIEELIKENFDRMSNSDEIKQVIVKRAKEIGYSDVQIRGLLINWEAIMEDYYNKQFLPKFENAPKGVELEDYIRSKIDEVLGFSIMDFAM